MVTNDGPILTGWRYVGRLGIALPSKWVLLTPSKEHQVLMRATQHLPILTAARAHKP